jgi:hypothetical protein
MDTRGEGAALVVFNPLPWPVKVPVEVERGSDALVDADGQPLPVQSIQPTTVAGQRRCCFVAELPPLGYRLFRRLLECGSLCFRRLLECGSLCFRQGKRQRTRRMARSS